MSRRNKPTTPKILFLSAWYPTKMDSMFGLFVKKHAVAASKHCHVFVIHACGVKIPHAGFTTEINHQHNLSEIIIYYPQKKEGMLSFLFNGVNWLKAYYKGYRYMKSHWGLPDVTHANILTRIVLLAWILKIRHKIPYIITEHWSRYLKRNAITIGKTHKMINQSLISSARNFTVVSHLLGEAIKNEKLCNRYTLLPNVVETDLFTIAPAENKTTEQVIIVHISCFEEQSKNMSALLKAVKLLSEKQEGFLLRMVGTGIDYESCLELAKELNILDRYVVFDGLKEGKALADILSKSHFSVLPSHYETFGIVVYESLSCGVPVVVSDVADFRKNITDERGILIENTDPDSIASAMEMMMNNFSKYAPHKLRKFATDHYSEDKVSQVLLKLYMDAMKKGES